MPTPAASDARVLYAIDAGTPASSGGAGSRVPPLAVGSTSTVSRHGRALIERWDGRTWSEQPVPTVGDIDVLSAVRSFGPSLAWAVGRSDTGSVERPLVLRWDGAAWLAMPASDIDARLYAVDGTGPDDIWAVGVQRRQPYALHWDGAYWSQVDVPNPSEHASLHGVLALAPDDVWAVGHFHVMSAEGSRAPMAGQQYRTLAVHFDGTAWSIVPTPNDPESESGLLFWLTLVDPADPVGGGMWAAGWSQAPPEPLRALIERWDGTAWVVVPAPRDPGTSLWGVTASSSGDAWATGYVDDGHGTTRPYALHWDGSAWSELTTAAAAPPRTIPDPALAPSAMWGVSAASDGSVWSVGAFTPEGAPSTTVVERLCPIHVRDGGFAPNATTAPRGTDVLWRFDTANAADRGVRDATGLDLFDAGLRPPGSSFTARYQAAGTYGVRDPTDGATGSVAVPLTAALNGGVIDLTWAAFAVAGMVCDVEVKRPDGEGFVPWRTGTSGTGGTFTPDAGAGVYAFLARLRDPVSGRASGWSPTARVAVA